MSVQYDICSELDKPCSYTIFVKHAAQWCLYWFFKRDYYIATNSNSLSARTNIFETTTFKARLYMRSHILDVNGLITKT